MFSQASVILFTMGGGVPACRWGGGASHHAPGQGMCIPACTWAGVWTGGADGGVKFGCVARGVDGDMDRCVCGHRGVDGGVVGADRDVWIEECTLPLPNPRLPLMQSVCIPLGCILFSRVS